VGPVEADVKVMVREAAVPLTVTLPLAGVAEYSDTTCTRKGSVPLRSVKLMVGVAEVRSDPFNVTPHWVPTGRPDSANVTG
jgi:hypothetical protein